jgi:hypothetical protein
MLKAAHSAARKAAIQSYRANVVTYVLAKLHSVYADRIDLNLVWNEQSVTPEFFAMLVEWCRLVHEAIVAGAGARNVTEFCKKDECWERVRALTLPTPQPIPAELGGDRVPPPKRIAEASADELINRCMSLNASDWGKVFAWASTSTEVTPFDLKVTNTIVGYAIDGWEKEPSAKQALRVGRVLEAAEKAGVLEPV